jgi:hypothetical protein
MNDDLNSNDDVNDDAVMSALAMHSSGTRSTRRSRRRPKVREYNSFHFKMTTDFSLYLFYQPTQKKEVKSVVVDDDDSESEY